MALFGAAAVSLGAFVRREARVPEPLLDPSWFRNRSFTGANLQILLATSVMCSLGEFDAQHHAAFVSGFSAAVTVNAAIAFAAAGLAAYSLRGPGVVGVGAPARPSPETDETVG